ncbi:MAG: hypothetical protein E7607_06810 [Ruminococcaceae bacterium]|nr:hypothetical protein [Oscillospiraceae bacterium]
MRFFSLILILAVALSLVCCGTNNKPCEKILNGITDDVKNLPAGKIYRSHSEAGTDGYFTESMRKAMYGEDSERYFSLMEEYALFVSSGEPCEIAVFKCYSATDARSVEFMCMNRLQLLRVALNGTGFSSLCDGIRVIREGRYVVFVMAKGYCGNPQKAVK